MQRNSSNDGKIAIPPNLLKNFNVYDILVPEKNVDKNSDAIKVDKLIDIDDCSQDSGFQDSDLSTALLDKNRDFDLVDLYQNIFVTPQHIQKKEPFDVVDDTCNTSKVVDAGFKHFFDMLESGQKIDWTNIAQKEEDSVPKHDFIEKKPRVLVPKVFIEPDSDSEDMINEILAQKNIEKRILGDVMTESLKDNSNESRAQESPKKFEKPNVTAEFPRLNLNVLTKDSKFESLTNKNLPRPSEIEPYLAKSQINNSSPNFVVQAIQKDEKVYKKKRLQKPESQTANFTKAPDFRVKSVVLPQIMSRLYARLEYLNEKDNPKKRLILDAGEKPVNLGCSTSNAYDEVSRKTNNHTSCPTSKNLTHKAENSLKTEQAMKKPNNISAINSLKKDNVKIREEAKLCFNEATKNIRVHTTDKPCPNCSNASSSKKINHPVGGPTKTAHGELSPVVLMEDCNKERLRALKQSQMFKDFVLKGKYQL